MTNGVLHVRDLSDLSSTLHETRDWRATASRGPTRKASPPFPTYCVTTRLVAGSIFESGLPMAVTQTAPSPTAISPPAPGTPTSMVADTLLVAGSTRDTLPSPWLSVQTLPKPSGQESRRGPHRNLRDHLFGFGVHARQQIVLRAGDPDGAGVESRGERTRRDGNLGDHLVSCRIDSREHAARHPKASRCCPRPAVIPPSVFATPEGMEATIFCDFGSTR